MKLSQASKRDLFALRECRLALAAIGFLVPSGADGSPPPSLPTATVIIDSDHGPVTFRAEIAADSASQQRGLMYRKRMSANAGMLFDFHRPQYENFWMKDTVLSLDLIFIREDGTISSIAPTQFHFQKLPYPRRSLFVLSWRSMVVAPRNWASSPVSMSITQFSVLSHTAKNSLKRAWTLMIACRTCNGQPAELGGFGREQSGRGAAW
jgi:uncharacterized membrane protein (UPF0127 family)